MILRLGHRHAVAGHVRILPDVLAQLQHERLAQAQDLGVALAHGQPRHRILEDLLEAQELDDALVHRRVEAQPALVRPFF